MSSQSLKYCVLALSQTQVKLKSEAGSKDLLNACFRLTRRPAWISLGRFVEIKEDPQVRAQEFILELRYHCIKLSKYFS